LPVERLSGRGTRRVDEARSGFNLDYFFDATGFKRNVLSRRFSDSDLKVGDAGLLEIGRCYFQTITPGWQERSRKGTFLICGQCADSLPGSVADELDRSAGHDGTGFVRHFTTDTSGLNCLGCGYRAEQSQK
jgi:hypothetical protein